MSASLPTLSSNNLASPEALRGLTTRQRGIHPILKAVRTTYRAQNRKPQLEPVFVEWIQRFLRLFPDEPVGRLALLHVQTFLRRLDQRTELTPDQVEQAGEALAFLRRDVLQFWSKG